MALGFSYLALCGVKIPEGVGLAESKNLHPRLREEEGPWRAWCLPLTKQGIILNINNLYKMARTKSCGVGEEGPQ